MFVDIIGAQGQWYGWISYGHLKEIPTAVEPGTYLSANQVLGKTDDWPEASVQCYDVNTEAGVHTHIEMFNIYRFACYKDWVGGTPINVPLNYQTRLGDAGRANYSTIRSQCQN